MFYDKMVVNNSTNDAHICAILITILCEIIFYNVKFETHTLSWDLLTCMVYIICIMSAIKCSNHSAIFFSFKNNSISFYSTIPNFPSLYLFPKSKIRPNICQQIINNPNDYTQISRGTTLLK